MPTATATHNAAAPAVAWTASPPPKSRAPSRCSQPSGDSIQWATGSYTSVVHSATNTAAADGRIRSAPALAASAAANPAASISNPRTSDSGAVGARSPRGSNRARNSEPSGVPTSPPNRSGPNASPWPSSVHWRITIPSGIRHPRKADSTFLRRTIPPKNSPIAGVASSASPAQPSTNSVSARSIIDDSSPRLRDGPPGWAPS